MSAKPARNPKPLAEIDVNVQKSKNKRLKLDTVDAHYENPESFIPLPYTEHNSKAQLPENIDLVPVSFFDLFWVGVIDHLVEATNAYASQKRPNKHQWRRPVSVSEMRAFLGVTIMMGVVRVPCIRRYWTLGLLSGSSMSSLRYYQIRRYIHVSMPQDTANLPHRDWWKKLEPLSSHLRRHSQELFVPSTHVSVHEIMIPFTGRSRHTVRIPSKPIPVGHKVLALCDSGYTLNWLFTSRTESIAELDRQPDLSPTSSAVLQLCSCLDSKQRSYIVYTDNGFSTIPLFRKLRGLSIGACGTTRINSAEYPSQLKYDTTLIDWNSMDGLVVDGVLCIRWMDNNIVRVLTTSHPWGETTLRDRRKPRNTSTNATVVRKAFGNQERKAFYIPTVIDDYNHHMNGVDLADQRRAAYTTHQRALRNWLAFLFTFLDISINNSFILFQMARTRQLNMLLDTGEISSGDILNHPLARPFSAELFRRLLYKKLAGKLESQVSKCKSPPKRRIRHLPMQYRKTNRIYFTKYTDIKSVAPRKTSEPSSNSDSLPNHLLERMSKQRECAVCRYEFRKGSVTLGQVTPSPHSRSRRRPKLIQYECQHCSPPTALCGPEPANSECFQRWHSAI